MLRRVHASTQHKKMREAHADDCVYFLPEKLRAAVRFTTEEFCKAAGRHVLKVNFGLAKTESLVVLQSWQKQSKKMKSRGESCWSAAQNRGAIQAHGLNVHAKWSDGP